MLSIWEAHAQPVYVFKSTTSKRNADGDVFDRKEGYRFRFANRGQKRLDPDSGEVVRGLRRPGIAYAKLARKNRALSELDLAEAAADMRENGYPEMTEKRLLDWWLAKHGGTRGVVWNIYRTDTGMLATDEDLEMNPGASPEGSQSPIPKFDMPPDGEYIVTNEDKSWTCTACGKTALKGLNGHRQSKAHAAAVTQKFVAAGGAWPDTKTSAAQGVGAGA